MNQDIIESGDPEFVKSAGGRIPAERWGTPEDYKGAVVFLTSKASDWIHGETLVVSSTLFQHIETLLTCSRSMVVILVNR